MGYNPLNFLSSPSVSYCFRWTHTNISYWTEIARMHIKTTLLVVFYVLKQIGQSTVAFWLVFESRICVREGWQTLALDYKGVSALQQ